MRRIRGFWRWFLPLVFIAVAQPSSAVPKTTEPSIEIVHEDRNDMAPDLVTGRPPIAGEITAAKALQAIYGNYDEATNSATWLADEADIAKIVQWTEHDVRRAGRKPETYKVVAIAEQQADARYLLLTAIEWDHRGAPVGGAIFVRSEAGWRLSWSRRIIARVGGLWPPRVDPVRIGPDRYGFLFYRSSSGGGYTDGMVELVGEIDDALAPLLILSPAFGDYNGDCTAKVPRTCWRYSSTFAFEANPHGREYFDVVRTTTGTHAEYYGRPIRRFSQKARYTFGARRYRNG